MRRAVAPMWLLGNATPAEDAAEATPEARARVFASSRSRSAPKRSTATSPRRSRCATRSAPSCRSAPTPIAASRPPPRAAISTARATPDSLFLEQPLGPHDLKALAALARIVADPARRRRGHPFARRRRRACRCRRRRRLAQADQARRHERRHRGARAFASGSACRSTSRPRSPNPSIASAAAVHLACAAPAVDWGVSLTHFYLAADIVKEPLTIADGVVALPDGPGLGVEVDEAAVARFTVQGGLTNGGPGAALRRVRHAHRLSQPHRARGARRSSVRSATSADWLAFADAWRGEYQPAMEEMRSGKVPFRKLDVLHRQEPRAHPAALRHQADLPEETARISISPGIGSTPGPTSRPAWCASRRASVSRRARTATSR